MCRNNGYRPQQYSTTSRWKAIASEWNLQLFQFNFAGMTDARLKKKYQALLKCCVVVFEDIDEMNIVQERPMATLWVVAKRLGTLRDLTLSPVTA